MPRLMALDVGAARIGVALSDASGFLASPYTTLRAGRAEAEIWADLQALIAETEAEGLIVGLPISLDGQLHAQAERIMAFTERLKTHISLPVVFWDERLSTVEAERLLAEQDQKSRKRRPDQKSRKRKQRRVQTIDALAATVILQSYLDQHIQAGAIQSSMMEEEKE